MIGGKRHFEQFLKETVEPDDELESVKKPKRIHMKKRQYRTVFISDVHLGTPGCQAKYLLHFLKCINCETLYLVGDIVDGWRLKRSWFWRPSHNEVIRRILKICKKGTRVIYIPGNHDEAFRDYVDHDLAGIELRQDHIHEAADGKRYWVLHGDEFDGVMKFAKWLAYVGDWAYSILLKLNTWFNLLRRQIGFPYWSLSKHIKHKVKNAVEFISKFEEAVASEARKRDVDGVVCGHIHHAEIRTIEGIKYCNDGDWVESCTALVEHEDGTMQIIHWIDEVRAEWDRRQAMKASMSRRKVLEAAE